MLWPILCTSISYAAIKIYLSYLCLVTSSMKLFHSVKIKRQPKNLVKVNTQASVNTFKSQRYSRFIVTEEQRLAEFFSKDEGSWNNDEG